MDYKDYYKIMGVKPEATDKDIKLAYRRLARKYHPDVNKEADAEDKFKELGEAYEVLRDPEKRKAYDQYKQDWSSHQQGRTQSPGAQWDQGGQASYQYSHDFFDELFGERSPFRRQSLKGADLHGEININLEDAYHGVVKELHLKAGQALKVKIPVGVRTGQKIRLAGQGEPGGHGGKPGDLYITVNINKHPFFDVVENNIYLTLPIAPWEAALGTTAVVPTLGGKVDLKIPAGSQGGQTLRLKKRGLPGKNQGDQFIILKIVTPAATTEADKALYKKMAEEMPFNPRESLRI